MAKMIVIFLFVVGFVSAMALGTYALALLLFVFGEGDYVGAVAYTPKWVFLFSPLVLLGRRKEVRDVLRY